MKTHENPNAPYPDVPYSGWREFIMWCGMGCLLFCGLLVGKAYFNRVFREIVEP